MIDKNSLKYTTVKVLAPATVANIVCGFDVLGMALDAPYDEMHITLNTSEAVVIKHVDNYNLPTEPHANVAGVALLALLKEVGSGIGFEVIINKIIKPGSGLGSSSASAAGAVVGANYLLDNYFSKQQLVQFAMCGEELASGAKHADNVAPCIYGGVSLITSMQPLDIVTIPAPNLFVTILHPQIEIKTADARQILRKEILLKDAVTQWGNVAGLVAGFFKNDYELISRSLQDVIIEPIRSLLIPAFKEVKEVSLAAGALGGGISGSGPSIFMLSKNKTTALAVENAMKHVYQNLGVVYHTHLTNINTDGVKIITN